MYLVNKDGWTAFHLSAREGDVRILRLFEEKDSNAWNTVSNNGRTPLHTACLAGRMVTFLQAVIMAKIR
jgi:ankyrin repeat protein